MAAPARAGHHRAPPNSTRAVALCTAALLVLGVGLTAFRIVGEEAAEEGPRRVEPRHDSGDDTESADAGAESHEPDDPTHFFLRSSYIQRLEPQYDRRAGTAEDTLHWQYNVYNLAAHLASQVGARRVIDIGCGSGQKLDEMLPKLPAGTELVCVDFGVNLEDVKRNYPHMRTIDIDLNARTSEIVKILSVQDLTDAVLVNSDNIEHLVIADSLMRAFSVWLETARLLVQSTPDRRARHLSDSGPPSNGGHVREWTLCEFVHFAAFHDVPVRLAGWTEENNKAASRTTLVIVAARDAAILGAADADSRTALSEFYTGWSETYAADCICEIMGRHAHVTEHPAMR